jgi:hypothetical protein
MKCIIELDFVAPCMTWKQKLFTENVHLAYMFKLHLMVDVYSWIVRCSGDFWGGPASGKVLHCWLLLRDYYFCNASTSKLNIRSEVALSDLGSGGLWGSACYLPNHGASGLRCKVTHIQRPMCDLFGMRELAVDCVCEAARSTVSAARRW